jgi:hypothetical protein
MSIEIKKLYRFLFVLTLLSLFVAVCGYLICKQYLNETIPVSRIVGAFYMFVPVVSVLIVEKWNFKKIFADYNIRLKAICVSKSLRYVFATAFLLPAVILFFSYLTGNILGIKEFGFLITSNEDLDPHVFTDLPAFFSDFTSRLLIGIPFFGTINLLSGCTINLFFAMGEEIAWRGFLEKEISISKKWKPLLIGIIWGLWHTPLILMGHNYGEYRIGGVFVMVIVCIAMAYYFSQALHRSGSLLIPAAMHGIINANAYIFVYAIIVKTGNPLLGPPIGLTFALSVATIIFVLWLFKKRTPNEKT